MIRSAILRLSLLSLVLLGTLPAFAQEFDRTLRIEVFVPPALLADTPQQVHVVVSGTEGRAVTVIGVGKPVVSESNDDGDQLFSETVQADGAIHPRLTVPVELVGKMRLVVTARGPSGIQRLFVDVQVNPPPLTTYISTDKPLYQPGQTVNIRTISFDPLTTKAADNREVELSVRNPQGVLVWRETVQTGPYGVAANAFPLGRNVPTGTYRVITRVGLNSAELPFEVRVYQLPKFIIKVETERNWYLADEALEATIRATYSFGEPVKQARVQLDLIAFDPISGFVRGQLASIAGETDGQGEWTTTWRVPDENDGKEFFGDHGRFPLSMRVRVVDQGGLTEVTSTARMIATQPLDLKMFPENNTVVPGIENRMFVVVSYPDGSPAPSTLKLESPAIEIDTNEQGVAEFTFTPKRDGNGDEYFKNTWKIGAVDNENNRPTIEWRYARQATQPGARRGDVRLRPNASILRENEGLQLRIDRSTRPLTDAERKELGKLMGYTLEVRKLDHAVLVRDISPGEANGDGGVDVTLPPDLYGQIDLVLHERRRVDDPGQAAVGGRTSEQRMLVNVASTTVFRARDDQIDIEIIPSLEQYAPGQPGEITLRARRRSGEPGPLILGVDIVDTALFGLASDERESVQMAFLLTRSVLSDNLHRYLLAEGIESASRQRLAATLFARHSGVPRSTTTEDSLIFARNRTRVVLDRLQNLVFTHRAYFSFRGRYHKPFEWMLNHRDETGITDDDLVDAWGNRIQLLEKYLDDEWVLISPGPDGKLDARKKDAPVNQDNVIAIVGD